MSDTKELALYTPEAIEMLAEGINMPLDSSDVLWTELREKVAPQGVTLPAAQLENVEIVVCRARRFASKFAEEKFVYWVVGLIPETQTIFNTVIGGRAVVEAIDAWVLLQVAHAEAVKNADTDRASNLEQLGAGRALRFTMTRKPTAKGQPYYVITA